MLLHNHTTYWKCLLRISTKASWNGLVICLIYDSSYRAIIGKHHVPQSSVSVYTHSYKFRHALPVIVGWQNSVGAHVIGRRQASHGRSEDETVLQDKAPHRPRQEAGRHPCLALLLHWLGAVAPRLCSLASLIARADFAPYVLVSVSAMFVPPAADQQGISGPIQCLHCLLPGGGRQLNLWSRD